MAEPRAVTLSDVAREAGVSLATASRAYNGSDRVVGRELRERVLAAAERLNYMANTPAQAMARGRSNVIGLVVHDIADPYFSTIAAGVMKAAEAEGLIVTVGSTLRNPAREVDYVDAHRGLQSRAIILAGSKINEPGVQPRLTKAIDDFKARGGRVVSIGQARTGIDSVVVGNRAGAQQLADELVDLGHRRIAILAGPENLQTARDRTSGFTHTLSTRGLNAVALEHGDFTRDGGYSAMIQVIDRGSPNHRSVATASPGSKLSVDCVLAANDVMAVGAMAACRDRGVRVPQDLSIAGFDDIATLRDVTPGLTTIALPLEQMGAKALELVLGEPAATPRRERITGELIVRESTPSR